MFNRKKLWRVLSFFNILSVSIIIVWGSIACTKNDQKPFLVQFKIEMNTQSSKSMLIDFNRPDNEIIKAVSAFLKLDAGGLGSVGSFPNIRAVCSDPYAPKFKINNLDLKGLAKYSSSKFVFYLKDENVFTVNEFVDKKWVYRYKSKSLVNLKILVIQNIIDSLRNAKLATENALSSGESKSEESQSK